MALLIRCDGVFVGSDDTLGQGIVSGIHPTNTLPTAYQFGMVAYRSRGSRPKGCLKGPDTEGYPKKRIGRVRSPKSHIPMPGLLIRIDKHCWSIYISHSFAALIGVQQMSDQCHLSHHFRLRATQNFPTVSVKSSASSLKTLFIKNRTEFLHVIDVFLRLDLFAKGLGYDVEVRMKDIGPMIRKHSERFHKSPGWVTSFQNQFRIG